MMTRSIARRLLCSQIGTVASLQSRFATCVPTLAAAMLSDRSFEFFDSCMRLAECSIIGQSPLKLSLMQK
jgi:hypothetical protein